VIWALGAANTSHESGVGCGKLGGVGWIIAGSGEAVEQGVKKISLEGDVRLADCAGTLVEGSVGS
jgi:hypothetical protein